jgi:hypothetical protein
MWQQAKMHLLYPNLSETHIQFILQIVEKYSLQEQKKYSFSEDFYQRANESIIEVLLRHKISEL